MTTEGSAEHAVRVDRSPPPLPESRGSGHRRHHRRLATIGAGTAWAGALLPERGGSPNADDIASLYTVVLVAGRAGLRRRDRSRWSSRSPLPRVAQPGRGADPRQHPAGDRLDARRGALIVFIAAFSLTKLGAIEHPDSAAANPADAATVGVGNGADDALHIEVVGRQYVWMYKYPNGAFSYEEMVAPVGVTVKLDIVSVDVAHSWWIPKLGGKFDAHPRLRQPHLVPPRAPRGLPRASAPSCAGATTPT